jgi:CubicO group peptidase (beta-lactamase class C family)
MKAINPSMISGSDPTQGSKPFERIRRAIRIALGAIGWSLLILSVLLTGYFTGWVLLAAVLLRSGPTGDIYPVLLVLVGLSGGLAWLVARYITSWQRVRQAIGIAFALVLVVGATWALIYPDDALFLARQVAWGDSSLRDYELFPERPISNAPPVFHFRQKLSPQLFQSIEYSSEGQWKQVGLEEFLQSTHTTSFIVIQDDAILYEGYFNGYNRDSIVTSFSVAKSFTSALVGIAIDEGCIEGVNDLVIAYLPELKGKGFDELTIRHLLDMSSGIRFVPDDEVSLLAQLTQFTDEGMSYSYPNLRSLALHIRPDGGQLGAEFNYNNYHLLLLGMILERTTGRPVAEYLQEKIWQPLGMEYPASWSLDSESSGFELMQSGINARAIDFARFGRLFLNNGDWNGAQIIPEAWVTESTAPDPNDNRRWRSYSEWKEANGYYKCLWWGMLRPDGSYEYAAQGHLGQWIYISPQEKAIIVRFGLDEGGVDSWPEVLREVAAKASRAELAPAAETSPAQDWPSSSPEEQGVDSAKLAEGLLAIQANGTNIHSLMIVRNGSVILDAYFYPYDGTIYHDRASVTKSLVTTLVGIAADQGRLDLDQPMVSFFPDRTIANRDARKERITVRHLASLTAGLECDPMDDEMTLSDMRASQDWVQFALDRKVVREPGTRFVYCGLQMHLLSAILQEATGMTALEFARASLFGPLGIRDVYWPADPQGYTHGWGDVCLRPGDMARLGLLFLNQGRWNGQQIVSREWIMDATERQIGTGTYRKDDYGYGWWVSRSESEFTFFGADGNGGQYIRVVPSLNLVLVTTGGGFSMPEIDPYLIAAIGDMEKSLPANPDGVARLESVVAQLGQSPEAQAVPPLPKIARAISGRTFVFEPNPLQLRSLRLDFDAGVHQAEATFMLDLASEQSPRIIGVGLDGVYRPSRSGRPVVARGSWADASTFVIDYNEGPGLAAYAMRIRFDGDRVHFEILGLGSFEASVVDS